MKHFDGESPSKQLGSAVVVSSSSFVRIVFVIDKTRCKIAINAFFISFIAAGWIANFQRPSIAPDAHCRVVGANVGCSCFANREFESSAEASRMKRE